MGIKPMTLITKARGLTQVGPFVNLLFEDEETAKAFTKEFQSVTEYDGAPLPDKDGILSTGDLKINLADAKAIYADDYCNVMITDVHAEGYKIHTFGDALTARRYIQMSAKFNPNMKEIIHNIYVDERSISYFYVDDAPTDYKVVMVYNRGCRLSLKHFKSVFDAFSFKNELTKKV